MESSCKSLIRAMGVKLDLWDNDINSLDIDIVPATITCVIGPNFSGKSLWLKTLAGIIPPVRGKLDLLGTSLEDMTARDLEAARLKLAYVSTGTQLLSVINGLQNVLLPAQYHRTGDNKSLTICALKLIADIGFDSEYLELLPAYMNDVQRFQLAIARALLLKPRVLLINNSFKLLDALSSRSFKKFLLNQVRNEQLALLLATHDMEYVMEQSSHIIFVTRHQVFSFNSGDELKNSNIIDIKKFLDNRLVQ